MNKDIITEKVSSIDATLVSILPVVRCKSYGICIRFIDREGMKMSVPFTGDDKAVWNDDRYDFINFHRIDSISYDLSKNYGTGDANKYKSIINCTMVGIGKTRFESKFDATNHWLNSYDLYLYLEKALSANGAIIYNATVDNIEIESSEFKAGVFLQRILIKVNYSIEVIGQKCVVKC